MKYSIIAVVVTLFLAIAVIPAYAVDKRAENNKNIAEFVLDTIKLPFVAIGMILKRDYEEIKKDLDYREHKGLQRSLRSQEVSK